MCAKISVNALIEGVHVTGRTVEIDKKLVRIYKNIVSFIKIHQNRALIVSRSGEVVRNEHTWFKL